MTTKREVIDLLSRHPQSISVRPTLVMLTSLNMAFFPGEMEGANPCRITRNAFFSGRDRHKNSLSECTLSSKWHHRQRENIFDLIMRFIADTDTAENYFGIFFAADADTAVLCSF